MLPHLAALRDFDKEGRFLAPVRENEERSFWRSRLRGEKPATLKEELYALLNDPRSSPAALIYSLFLIGTILLSLVSLFISTLPQYWLNESSFLFIIETFCAVIFTLDYIARLCLAPVWYKWIISPFPLVDFVSTVPYYIEEIVEHVASKTPAIRVLRVFRVLRVLKLGRFSENFIILSRTFANSLDGLFMLMFLFVIGLSLFSSALFFAEQTGSFFDHTNRVWYRNDGSVSPFQDIPTCMWYAIVSMTTLGYGDTYPVTGLGRAVGVLTMIYGVFMLAFPITLLGGRFQIEWKTYHDEQRALSREHVVHHVKTYQELLDVLQQHIVDVSDLYEAVEDKIKAFEEKREDLMRLIAEIENRVGAGTDPFAAGQEEAARRDSMSSTRVRAVRASDGANGEAKQKEKESIEIGSAM